MQFRSAILSLTVGLVGAGGRAQDAPPPDAALTALGLEAEKTRYVFPKAEDALRDKYQDALAARELAQQALAKVEESAAIEQTLLELQAGEQQLQAEISAARSSTAGLNYGRNRYTRYYRNQVDAAVREQQRNLEGLRKQIAQAKKQKPSVQQQQAAESAARAAMARAREVVKEVNDAYDALETRYNEIRAREGVQQALEDAGRPKKIGYQLGPSEESDKIGRWAKGILKIRAGKPTASPRKPVGDATKNERKPSEPRRGAQQTKR